MTAEQIVRECCSLVPNNGKLLVLTGGEPSLQVDENLVSVLHDAGFYICIETNGTHCLPSGIDWITCSPKEGSRLVLTKADEVKLVFTGNDSEQYLKLISAEHYYLQPCSCKNTTEVIDYILRHPHWRLSLQTHKYLNIR